MAAGFAEGLGGFMSQVLQQKDDHELESALRAARDTRYLVVDDGVRHRAVEPFVRAFGTRPALIVADERTFEAAGRDVVDGFYRSGHACEAPFLFDAEVTAEISYVDRLCEGLAAVDAIPVAVGSGTINDLTKLASSRLGRPYMVVATAASMDGYTAFGASITDHGSKQTFDCPAPRAVLADLEVISCAPEGLNASGYADLMAKTVAGADWILADAVRAEPIDRTAWQIAQGSLRSWLDAPRGIAASDPCALRRLTIGLMMSGFAMQAAKTSRPASGCEHQFSHLWDMQHHSYRGVVPSHGFKVGIGTLASLALYRDLLEQGVEPIDVTTAVAQWPSFEEIDSRLTELLGEGELAAKAREETRAKYVTREALRSQLMRARDVWPELRSKLLRQLIPYAEAREMLSEAGCPTHPQQIGISVDRLRRSYEQAYYIRRRYTILDFCQRFGVLEPALDRLFNQDGSFAREPHLDSGVSLV